jgi:hypothetical protein
MLMHAIDRVFRPNDMVDNDARKDPISTSKLGKQDAAWQDTKRALGWDYAVRSKNLLVAPHRKAKVTNSLKETLSQRRLGLTKWQSLLGQLRSLVPGMPGGEGQFSILQAALCNEHKGRVRISSTVRSQLLTFRDILEDDERVTHLEELTPGDPIHIGACDAAKAGMGGVWFPDEGAPLLWRHPFPLAVREQIVSYDNPTGRLTNSDLELAGTVVHQAILGNHAKVAGETAHAPFVITRHRWRGATRDLPQPPSLRPICFAWLLSSDKNSGATSASAISRERTTVWGTMLAVSGT